MYNAFMPCTRNAGWAGLSPYMCLELCGAGLELCGAGLELCGTGHTSPHPALPAVTTPLNVQE